MRTLATIIQNLWFWPLFVFASGVYIGLVGLFMLAVCPFESKRRMERRLRRAISGYGRLIVGCAWPFVRVEYRDLAVGDTDNPVIFICNHRSLIDAFMLAYLPIEGVQITKAWPIRLPVLGGLARLAGYMSVTDLELDELFRRAGSLLDQKVCLGAFPEGTRSDGREMGQFGSAIFRLAKERRATLVPFAISGSERVAVRGSWWLRPGSIRVDKLPALRWVDYRDLSVFKLKNRVREMLISHLQDVEGQ